MQLLADIQLIPATTAPGEARRIARDVLPPDLPRVILEDVLIVISELITFKVGEDRIASDGVIGLRLLHDGLVRVEVIGAESLRPDDWPGDPWDRTRGLISRIATRWGVIEGERVVAWVEIG